MLNSTQQYKLRKFIQELKKYRGRHTELVTVYIPAGYDLNKIIQHLAQEQGTASNIKDKTNRLNVQNALERMIRHLRIYNKTPENGLAAFSGNIASQEGKQDVQVWSIEPPLPLTVRMYRCDHVFVIEPIEEMLTNRETYGLLVMDNREATLATLRGKSIQVIRSFGSNVPGKLQVGGWCLDPETLIFKSDGSITKISDTNAFSNLKSFETNKARVIDSKIMEKSVTNHTKLLKVITRAPHLEINSSPNHTFFVMDGNKIKEKLASELKLGDFLLTPEKVEINGQLQYLNYVGDGSTKLPSILTADLARFIGYIIGDGSYDKDDRIELAEARESVAKYYSEIIYTLFGKRSTFRYRKDKNYYEVRINSRNVVRFVKSQFPEKKYCEESTFPQKIMISNNEVVASFLKGLFDAEGFVDADETAITMKNKLIIGQVHLSLLRFGVVASFCKAERGKWSVRITDKESLINFRNFIGFVAEDKRLKLDKLIQLRTDRSNTRQIVWSGKSVRSILERFGYLKQDFKSASMFLCDKRGISKTFFYKNFLSKIRSQSELYGELKRVVDYPLLPSKIEKIEEISGEFKLIDIGVENENFFANGILVHNSQQRYARLREEAENEFYKRIAEVLNPELLAIKEDLKGILIGGPGPTKEKFHNGAYINNELKKKVIGIKDIAYTDESGLHELVEKSQDILAEAELVKEKQIVQELLTFLATDSDKVVYGRIDVNKALEYGAVEKLLLSESLNDILEYEEKATKTGTQVFIVSVDTKEGQQLRDLGGIAAILRYKIKDL